MLPEFRERRHYWVVVCDQGASSSVIFFGVLYGTWIFVRDRSQYKDLLWGPVVNLVLCLGIVIWALLASWHEKGMATVDGNNLIQTKAFFRYRTIRDGSVR